MALDLNRSKVDIPHFIQESWRRCYSNGLAPTTIDKEQIIGEFELAEYHNKYEELLYYSTPILEDVSNSIRGTEFLILIATQEGFIIDTIGEPSFIRHTDNVALKKGANWLEEAKGTNAIGTAIIENQSIIVHGNQHFWEDNHFLTCTAAPIHDANGELLGVLNISSYRQNYNPLTLGLVKRTAHSIEQSLLLAQKKRQSEHDLQFIYDHYPSPLITVNKNRQIIRLNPAATQVLGTSEKKIIGQTIDQFLPTEEQFTSHLLTNDGTDILLQGQAKSTHLPRYSFDGIISQDPQLNELKSIAKKAAVLNINLLISGETGTGKELFAQSIHSASFRNEKPFIAINCSAIPETLLESELFGYEKGAFTGANKHGQLGKFEAADGGTLFLDEIGDMPLAAQATLLRVLQEKCVTRIGGTTPRPINVRIIAATHKNLPAEIEAGRFRADLYFRLNGFTLKLPPLRKRRDITVLAEHVLAALPFKKEQLEITDEAKAFIAEYDWPGNFRQLQNILQQAAFLTEGRLLTKSLLSSLIAPTTTLKEPQSAVKPLSLRDHEMNLIKQVLSEVNGNISQAAKILNIGRNTLYRKMKEFNITIISQK